MNEDRLVVSDELWEKIAPLLPGKAPGTREQPVGVTVGL